MASRGARCSSPHVVGIPLTSTRRWDGDSGPRGRPDEATVYHGGHNYHCERRDWSGEARPEDLASRPRYERRERDGQRGYAREEDYRERNAFGARHDDGHADSHWRAACEPTQRRSRDRDWENLPGVSGCRRGEGPFSVPAWRHIDGNTARNDAHAEHYCRYEQPLHMASGRQGRELPYPDNRLSPAGVPPHAGVVPRPTGDAGAAWRASPRESVTGQKRDRDWEPTRECERDGKGVWRGELKRSHGCAWEHHGERRSPDILSEGRVDRGIQTFGPQAGRHEVTATRSDPQRHDEQRMHGAGGGERGRSHADHRALPLAPTGVAPPFASRVPAYCAAPGLARGPGPQQLNKQLNQRLTLARSAGELLRLHAEHGGSFNEVNLATCWSRLGRAGCGEGFAWELDALRKQTLATLGEWDGRQLGNLAHALGKLGACGDAWRNLWEAVARATLLRCAVFNAQGLANTAWAYAKAGHAAPALLDAIAAEAARRMREFKAQELAITVWAYATAGHAAPALFDAVAAEAVPRVREFDQQNLANTAWAYATAGRAALVLLDAIAAEAEARIREFIPQGLANMAWAFAKAGHDAPALLDAIAVEAARRMREFKPQELASTAWAYATAGHAAPALFDTIAAEAVPRVREFNAQGLANTAWAYATAGHPSPVLLDAIAAEASPRMHEFNPQNLAITAWAYATAGLPAPALLDAIAAEVAARVREFNPQNLANTAWAYATAGRAALVLLDAIAAEAEARIREFIPQGLANMAWAFAKAGHDAPALLDAIAVEAARRMREFKPQELANTAWAYATAGRAWPALLDAIAAEAAPRVGEFNPQELASTAWAYATAGHPAPALLDAIAAEAAPRLVEFTQQHLANTAWAFAAANRPTDGSGLFGQHFARRCEEVEGELTLEALCQLHQWALWHSGERGCSNGLPSDDLLELCRAAFCRKEGRSSQMQRHVGAALASLGLCPEEEVRLAEGYSLDFVVEWRGEQIGVEVDGPSHFVGRESNGATLLKRRQLRHLGWRLVSVPYWEWDEVSASSQRAEEYLASRLDGLDELGADLQTGGAG